MNPVVLVIVVNETKLLQSAGHTVPRRTPKGPFGTWWFLLYLKNLVMPECHPPRPSRPHSWASCSCLNSPQIQNSYINIKACEVCIDQDFAKMVYEVPYRMIAGDFVRSYPTKVQKAHLLRFQCGWQQASAKWWTGWLFSPPNIQFIPSWSKGSYKKMDLEINDWNLKIETYVTWRAPTDIKQNFRDFSSTLGNAGIDTPGILDHLGYWDAPTTWGASH